MKKTIQRMISIILSVIFVVQLLPMQAIAEADNKPEIEKGLATAPSSTAAPDYDAELANTGKELSPIIGEDISKRTESTKHFRLANGSYIAATYGLPVHYEQNGEWVEIDNTLTAFTGSKSEVAGYRTTNANNAVTLPDQLGEGQYLTLTHGKYTVKLSYADAGKGKTLGSPGRITNPDDSAAREMFDASKVRAEDLNKEIEKFNNERMSARKASSSVIYENVLPDTDFEYIVNPRGIKENIIVKTPQEKYQYSFTLDLGGLVAVQNGDGSISLHEPGKPDEAIFVLNAPYMMDAKGEISYLAKMEIAAGEAVPDSTEGVPGPTQLPERTKIPDATPEGTEKPEPTDGLVKATETPEITAEVTPEATPGNTPEPTDETAEAPKLSSRNTAPKTTAAEPTPENTEKQAEETGLLERTKSPDITPQATPEPTPDSITAQGRITITLIADTEWMNAKERAFPVIIDPTIIKEIGSEQIRDSYIQSSYPDSNVHHVGWLQIVNSLNDISRAYIDFTLPELPVNYMIMRAEFWLGSQSAYANPTSCFNVYDCAEADPSWAGDSYSATWNNQPLPEDLSEETIIDYSPYLGLNEWHQFDITKIVKRWYETGNNKGIAIALTQSSSHASCSFYSSRYGIAANKPKLIITYRDNRGLEGYWSYASFNVGDAGTAHVNEYTGNLVFTRTDASTFGLNAPVSIGHVYNGYMADELYRKSDLKSGFGWKLTAQKTVRPSMEYGLTGDAATLYPYVYEDGDGTAHFLRKVSPLPSPSPTPTLSPGVTPTPTPYCMDEDGLGLTLTHDDLLNLKLSDDKGSYMLFDASTGNILEECDTNGNRIIYSYGTGSFPSALHKITDGAGHELEIFYLTQDSTALVSQIKDPSGRLCTFSYAFGNNNRLTQITNLDGKKTKFTYYDDHHLQSVTDSSGYTLVFEYTPSEENAKRVKSITEYADEAKTILGQKVSFDYSNYNTTIIRTAGVDGTYGNGDDIFTTAQFDNAGRKIGSFSKVDGKVLGAENHTYTASSYSTSSSDIKSRNRIATSASFDQGVNNLLTNGNFERYTGWILSHSGGLVSYSAAFATSHRYFGQRSLALEVDSCDLGAESFIWQSVDLDKLKPNTTYTLSGYVKTSNITTNNGSYGAAIAVSVNAPAPTGNKNYYSEFLTGTTDSAIDGGWRRLQVTFTTGSNTTGLNCRGIIKNAEGIAYFDGLQLEEGGAASGFNFLENAGFEEGASLSMWEGTADLESGDVVTANDKHTGSQSFKILGNPGKNKAIFQEVPISGSQNDTYILSGWAKADAVPRTYADDSETKKFSMFACVYYDNDRYSYKYTDPFYFNATVSDWQFLSAVISLSNGTDQTPTSIRVYISYDKQANTTYFDDFMLTKEPVQSYTYDDDGNLVGVVANAEQKSSMEYENDNLTKSIDPKGYAYEYEYDAKHNMTQAKSQTGVKYDYTYNSRGQATRLQVNASSGSQKMLSTVGYSGDGAFITVAYDAHGWDRRFVNDPNTGLLKKETDPYYQETQYTYKTDGTYLPDTVTKTVSGATMQVQYTWDSQKRLTKVRHNGFDYGFVYDAWNQVQKITVPGPGPTSTPQPLVENTYNEQNGLLMASIYGTGDGVAYTYDKRGNLESMHFLDSQRYRWQYDSAGRITRHQDPKNKRQYDYVRDGTGLLIRNRYWIPSLRRRFRTGCCTRASTHTT